MDELFDEYNDQDATSCACGDYNAYEEREVFNDREYDYEADYPFDYSEDIRFDY